MKNKAAIAKWRFRAFCLSVLTAVSCSVVYPAGTTMIELVLSIGAYFVVIGPIAFLPVEAYAFYSQRGS
jgi:hypothetical protein